MRYLLIIVALFIYAYSFSQIDSGIHEFKEQAKKDTPDLSKAYRILSSQVKSDPKNAELRYFLGYTIDRMNAGDGKMMSQLTKDMTIKASEQFEEVNRLEPIYKGEIFILDPQNLFKRPVYFTSSCDSSNNLFLSPYLVNEGLVSRVAITKVLQDGEPTVCSNLLRYNIDSIKEEEIKRSRDAIIVLNNFRSAYLTTVYDLATRGKLDKARELMDLLAAKFKKDKLPFISEEWENLYNTYYKEVHKDNH